MKVLFVLSALAAVALAKPGAIAPIAYSAGLPYYNNLGYSAFGYNYAAAPAISYAAAPAVSYAAAPAISYAAAPVAVPYATKTQYHAQDELGQASYGYAHPGQTHNAVRDAFGNVAGSYSYVDPAGKVVKTDYIADGAGFRVASNALPVAPAVPAVPLPVAPLPVQDTPEVVAARASHLAEVAAAKSRSKRGVIATPLAYHASPLAYHASPLAYHASPLAYSTPLAYHASPLTYAAAPLAAPAVREATLTTVVNTPGHAVSYRVD